MTADKKEVRVGQTYEDNDSRCAVRMFTVLEIAGDKAVVLRGGRRVKIKIKRLQNRGGRGYSLKEPAPAKESE